MTYDGETYRVKAHEVRRIVDRPRAVAQTFEIALDIHLADGQDLERLRAAGWNVVDPQRDARGLVPLHRVVGSYGRHREAAWAIAEHYFGSGVLTGLLDRVGATP